MIRWLVLILCFCEITFGSEVASSAPSPAPTPSGWAQEFEQSRMDPVGSALRASRIANGDSVQTRINKLLFLLNHNNYLHAFALDEEGKGYPPFQELKEEDQTKIRKMVGDGKYEMDSLRTTEEILGYRCGGHCSSHARSFARLLEESGVNGNRIRIVSAVNDEDLKKICPGKKGQARDAKYNGGASGHVFVMVQLKPGDEKSWTLINTTHDPIRPDQSGKYRGVHGPELSELLKKPNKGSHKFALAKDLLQKLDASDVEMSSWPEFSFDPTALKKRVEKEPVSIPEAINQSGPFKPMTIFSVETSRTYLRHTFKERLNLIASGEVNNMKCRYDCTSVSGDSRDCKGEGCTNIDAR